MHWIAQLQSGDRNQFGFAITYALHFSGACCAPVIWMLVNSSVLKNSNVLVLSTVCLVLFSRWADCATIQSHSSSSPCTRKSDRHRLCSELQSTSKNCMQVFSSFLKCFLFGMANVLRLQNKLTKPWTCCIMHACVCRTILLFCLWMQITLILGPSPCCLANLFLFCVCFMSN